MSCVESLLSDLERVMENEASSDIKIVCQGQEIKVHKLILSARSPVFHAMLGSDMVEKIAGVISIDDACVDVVKQMVRYMYIAKIDHSFTRIKELLVLANKYQVLELVNYCSSKIFESLSEDNALEIGMFGEMHNSEVLINRCAKYICYDMTDSLNEDWMEKIKESPKLMLQIIKNLRDVHENKLHEIKRMDQGMEQWVHGGRINAVAFEVDAKVWLRGIGLYGAMDNSKYQVHIQVFLNDDCLLEENKEYSGTGSANPVKIVLSSPVKIKPNRRYDITTEITGGPTLYGRNAKKVVQSTGADSFDVTFFTSPMDQNGGGTEMGQIPALYFRAPFTY
eukprot:TRINITY_DN9374_c0_g1_i1.p1 TRINITY_DN9374_c0_g1~~TRINITY_DN9374_c0_g1_i1.p1  ORF type:complete len:337 (-),score=91.90 TRINITY_DN9374_c0_g1_i1:485-1495(-)